MAKSIGAISLTHYTSAEETYEILKTLRGMYGVELQRVPNPTDDEPDFYLNRVSDDD